MGITRYTTRTLHGSAMLGPSQPRQPPPPPPHPLATRSMSSAPYGFTGVYDPAKNKWRTGVYDPTKNTLAPGVGGGGGGVKLQAIFEAMRSNITHHISLCQRIRTALYDLHYRHGRWGPHSCLNRAQIRSVWTRTVSLDCGAGSVLGSGSGSVRTPWLRKRGAAPFFGRVFLCHTHHPAATSPAATTAPATIAPTTPAPSASPPELRSPASPPGAPSSGGS